VYFLSDNVGWTVGNAGTALKTVDGGDTWSPYSPGALNLNGVFFTDSSHGWIVGDGGKVIRTVTGGTSWSTSTPTSASLYGVHFVSQTAGWAVGKGVVLRTTDGGNMWSSAGPTTQTLRDVHFASALLGWAVGSNGVVLKTVNGGLSWTSSSETSSDLYSVHFVSTTLGWAVGEAGIILKTTDGGASWEAQREGTSTYRSVHFVDDLNGWAVGTVGAVARTVDGGDTWTVTNEATVALNGVFFASIPAGVSVIVATDPPGLAFTVDDVDYTSTAAFHWEPGSSHTIATSSPQAGGAGTQYVWSRWSNDGPISQTVSPTASTTYIASFTPQHYLTMQPAPNGSTAPPGGWYDEGAQVQISATPDPGYAFNGWTGAGTGSYTGWANPATVTMNGPVTETPSFGTDVAVVVRSATAGRSFTVDGVSYSSPQNFTWAVGSSHTLEAPSPQSETSSTRYIFASWSDNGSATHSVSPVSNTTYTVTYQTQYLLTTQGTTGGTVTPASGWWNAGASVAVTADADSGYYFQSWTGSGSGSYSGSSNPKTIVLNGPVTQQANFVAGTAPAYPATLTVLDNAPNPAITQTSIRFGLPRDSDVRIEVFDVRGRRVFEDEVEGMLRGWQDYVLDLTGPRTGLRSGVYFARVTAANQTASKRFVVIR
jgi:photosystem II stability/assembly factor-like uncharacterized protein